MVHAGIIKIVMTSLFLGLAAESALADEFVIYGGESFPPQIYLENGQAKGIIPALLERLSKDTGDTYRLVLLPWKRALGDSEAGLGGITSISLTSERAKIFDYSEPLYSNPVKLTVLKSRLSEFRDYNDLRGKVLGVPLGAQFGGKFDSAVKNNEVLIDTDNNPVSRLKKLLRGRIDAAILGGAGLKETIRQDADLAQNSDKLAVLPFPLTEDYMYLAFPKSMHQQAALDRFNKALAAMKKTSEYQKIVDLNSSN
jgi:ABC-type amino acid transport substrate-binding protein